MTMHQNLELYTTTNITYKNSFFIRIQITNREKADNSWVQQYVATKGLYLATFKRLLAMLLQTVHCVSATRTRQQKIKSYLIDYEI